MDVTPSTSKGTQGQQQLPQAHVNHSSGHSLRPLSNIIEDEVDQQLWKQNGKIQRKRDEKL